MLALPVAGERAMSICIWCACDAGGVSQHRIIVGVEVHWRTIILRLCKVTSGKVRGMRNRTRRLPVEWTNDTRAISGPRAIDRRINAGDAVHTFVWLC